MSDSYEKRKEIAFNAGMFHAYYVAGLMNKASDNYNGGDFFKCYTYLQSARDRMHADLDPKEVVILNAMEKEIVYLKKKYQNAKIRKEHFQYKEEYVSKIRDFLHEIMNCMRMSGYLPTKRDRARLGF